ncbi:hypothetical protein HPB52_025049 [Rhipicephalus sanguineus]|uniref:Uncharacterized protein n=1 Tax=Rhipicephalus sanguineus TaxID=34632 RepID=A0A9D4YRT5_RHISA|nr:hypothetical protein HPB52_025049 [Rhipicephalus sanguineus]
MRISNGDISDDDFSDDEMEEGNEENLPANGQVNASMATAALPARPDATVITSNKPAASKKAEFKWVNKDFAPSDVDCHYNTEVASTCQQPLVYFSKYFTEQIFEDLAEFTNSSGEPSEDLGDVASEGAAGDQAQTSWDALLDAGVVPDCDTFCTYVGADADTVTTEELSDAEIVRAVTGVHNDDSDEHVNTLEPNVGEPDVLTPAQALDATDLLRRFFGAHDDGEDGLEIAAAAEKAVIRLKKSRQKSIKDYFSSK